jgi:hypothetical protein
VGAEGGRLAALILIPAIILMKKGLKNSED